MTFTHSTALTQHLVIRIAGVTFHLFVNANTTRSPKSGRRGKWHIVDFALFADNSVSQDEARGCYEALVGYTRDAAKQSIRLLCDSIVGKEQAALSVENVSGPFKVSDSLRACQLETERLKLELVGAFYGPAGLLQVRAELAFRQGLEEPLMWSECEITPRGNLGPTEAYRSLIGKRAPKPFYNAFSDVNWGEPFQDKFGATTFRAERGLEALPWKVPIFRKGIPR